MTLDELQALIDEDKKPAEYDSILAAIAADESADDEERRRAALLRYLDDDSNPDDVSNSNYGDNVFSVGRRDYRVLTDDEANAAASEYIADSLWAFNAGFLAGETGLPAECFEALADKCEGANDPILRMIEKTCGLESFVDSATSADGRGHFLATYDSEENESGEFFIYRVN